MSWDGGPAGWKPPAEAEAAREAVEKFEREREAADHRTREVCDAIHAGFGVLADALLLAAGVPDDVRADFWGRIEDADDDDGVRPGTFGEGAFASPGFLDRAVADDAEVDELLRDPEGHE